ncbi:hypothetical protein AB0I77_13630 [Streptomyces sp. NPDC050619]|uniref:hypothetical protein n=1 Tax=Streptomyces sp. NPDC050619 TaxID=3157214 RepID=UPI003431B85B
MGVIDSQWWSLWWPWMVVWLLTAACCAVLVRYALIRAWLPRRRRRGGGRMVSGMCIYLHETWVRSIADIFGIPNADKMTIAQRTNDSSGFGVLGRFGFGSGKAQHDKTRERVIEYLEQNTPMKALRLILEKMRAQDMVVDADLTTGRLVLNAALAETMRDAEDRQTAPLTAVRSDFVSVTGLFTARSAGNGDVVLRARYGQGEPAAQVKITCKEDWVRAEFQVEDYDEGEFPATCLGRVRTWNGATGELTLDPVSVFH